jgi:hypothetical protein
VFDSLQDYSFSFASFWVDSASRSGLLYMVLYTAEYFYFAALVYTFRDGRFSAIPFFMRYNSVDRIVNVECLNVIADVQHEDQAREREAELH